MIDAYLEGKGGGFYFVWRCDLWIMSGMCC